MGHWCNLGLTGPVSFDSDPINSDWINLCSSYGGLTMINPKSGLHITGDNPDMARNFGLNTGRMELMGLILSGSSLAGA